MTSPGPGSSADPSATSTSTTSATFASAEAYAASKGVSVKAGVDLSNVSAASVATIGVVADVASAQGLPAPVITSGRDGKHGKTSLHYAMPSRALDYRGNNVTDAQLRRFAADVGVGLGSKYDAIAEVFPRNPTWDHLHVEYDP